MTRTLGLNFAVNNPFANGIEVLSVWKALFDTEYMDIP